MLRELGTEKMAAERSSALLSSSASSEALELVEWKGSRGVKWLQPQLQWMKLKIC